MRSPKTLEELRQALALKPGQLYINKDDELCEFISIHNNRVILKVIETGRMTELSVPMVMSVSQRRPGGLVGRPMKVVHP